MMDLSKTELYDAQWLPSKIKFKDRPPSAPRKDSMYEEKTEEKPRKLFKPKGTGTLSAMIKAEKAC
jgi:hypothetical protein